MTNSDYERERLAKAKEHYFEFHGCLTGDCPHNTQRECLEHGFKAGYDAALTSGAVKDLSFSLEHMIVSFEDRGYGDHPTLAAARASLARYNALIKEMGGKDE